MQFLTFCLIGFQQSGLGKSLFIDTDFTTILILAIEPLVVAGICYAENSLIQKKNYKTNIVNKLPSNGNILQLQLVYCATILNILFVI